MHDVWHSLEVFCRPPSTHIHIYPTLGHTHRSVRKHPRSVWISKLTCRVRNLTRQLTRQLGVSLDSWACTQLPSLRKLIGARRTYTPWDACPTRALVTLLPTNNNSLTKMILGLPQNSRAQLSDSFFLLLLHLSEGLWSECLRHLSRI